MNAKPNWTTKGLGFFLYVATALFIVAVMLFTSSGLRKVTPARISDCSERIEIYKGDLEYAKNLNKEEKEIKAIENKITYYQERINMLENREKLYSVSMGFLGCCLILVAFLQSFKTASFKAGSAFGMSSKTYNYYNFLSAPICAMFVLLAIGVSYRCIFAWSKTELLMLVCSVIVAAVVFLWYRKSPYISARLKSKTCVIKGIEVNGGDIFFLLPAAGIVFLLLVNLLFGVTVNGAKLWINLGFTMIQPGELVKVLLIILFASSYGKTWRAVTSFIVASFVMLIMLLLKDMGTATVVVSMMIIMLFRLLDNKMTFSLYEHKKLLVLIAVLGIIMFFVLLAFVPYARERFLSWGNAMENEIHSQQSDMLKAMVFGGIGGLGIENSSYILNIFAIENDMALAGLTAVFGYGMLLIVLLCYALLIIIPLRKYSLYREFYFASAQVSVVILAQVLLNALGAVDMLPFTGIVAPFISDGGSALLSFCAMMGILLATLHPVIKPLEVNHNG